MTHQRDQKGLLFLLQIPQRLHQKIHLARHYVEVYGEGVMLLDDVGVIDFDERVSQIFGRSVFEQAVDFMNAAFA